MGLTIDIESLVQKALATWIAGASKTAEAVFFMLFPWLSWLRPVVRWVIKWLVEKYSKKAEKELFFRNTIVLATDQAKDFEKKWDAVESLPEDVSDEDWERAEREKMAAFDDLFKSTR